MKKEFRVLMFSLCLVSISACGNKMASDSSNNTPASSLEEETTESRDSKEKVNNETREQKKKMELDELEEIVSTDIENTIASIKAEYETLVMDIDTYDKYLENTDKIEGFYQQICEDNKQLCIRMREYSMNYAETIMSSDKSNDDKYDDLEELFDCIYDDGGDEIYDEIYDDLFDDLFDNFYDGILDDAYDNGVAYDEWSSVHSNEYDWWSDARSDVYDDWSDFRSDVYDFWSDMRSAIWKDDIEKAEEKMADFQEDIEKLKSKNNQRDTQLSDVEKGSTLEPEDTENHSEDIENTEEGNRSEDIENTEKGNPSEDVENIRDKDNSGNIEDSDKEEKETLADGVRPEFKEAMDSYEAFYDEYCDILKQYNKNPTDFKLVAKYTDMMVKSVDMTKKFEEWEDDELNNAELKYYFEVNHRVSQKLIEVSDIE